MRDFAPVPFRALEPETLSDSALRLLAYYLMVWNYQYRPAKIEISDHEVLNGHKDRHTHRRLPACGLRRNTLKRARTELESLGFIKSNFVGERNQEHVYKYELIPGMALNLEGSERQFLTSGASADDDLYKEENIDQTPADESRDSKERPSRELSEERKYVAEQALKTVEELYEQHHPAHHPMPNPSSVKSVLRNFLLDNPKWPEATILRGIRNYFLSENTNKIASPERWVRRIPEFSDGPLDRYNRPIPSIQPSEPASVRSNVVEHQSESDDSPSGMGDDDFLW